ncbi:dynein heavy chain 2, axonemal [Trichonephila inaurata madagascariensis]|uniref:Dynein heavy chain 2, axonemal n=1 Tax=Trichonephila inaurata madagascariensis TaxID=2747483 RepID=A0A8X6XND6_9ARAC|nr:dynein heavy chain 2, axonemal [Trichonephila inaurata madagascariensis]
MIKLVLNRCFLSFTTALHLNQGATLKGCRSSGKTETLKDLAVNLGKYVLVINCSESLDQRSSARMLTGLAQALATDIKLVFSMAKDQLSRYCHYDFGLRTITNFLKYIGKQKRLFPKSSDLEIIVSTLRSITLPKLHSSDVRIFESILETVFSNIKGINVEVSKFVAEIKKTLLKKSLQPETAIVTKINQLYEIKDYDHAIILLGEAGSGKTTSWQTLKETCTDLHEVKPEEYPSINVYTFNPKAFNLSELYGYFNEKGVWMEGLFSTILKKACKDSRADKRWIVLNGLLDVLWLESIDSLLDSNKVLTAANGERIMLLPEVTLLFETTNLIHCSPSVISHCGIIYHESTIINWNMYLKSWLQNLEIPSIKEILEELFETYLNSVVEYCNRALESARSVSLLNKISSFVQMLNAFLKQEHNPTSEKRSEMEDMR